MKHSPQSHVLLKNNTIKINLEPQKKKITTIGKYIVINNSIDENVKLVVHKIK